MSSGISSRVGVLIHGCHLYAKEWNNIEFGSADQKGRVTKGVMVAVKHKAELIFWGTGASEKKGMKESVYIYTKAIGSKLETLAERAMMDPGELKDYLKKVSFIDTVTQNTNQEVRAALTECQSRGIKELILVSSPTHIARCFQEALKIKADSHEFNDIDISATASDTCFADSTPADVTIIEPSHRGDLPKATLNKIIPQAFKSMRTQESVDALEKKLNASFADLEKKLLKNSMPPSA